jgi:lyso-ornithine lipid O-acyltransferase
MRTIAGILKLTVFILFTVSGSLIYLIGLIFVRLFNRSSIPWKNLFMRSWAGGTAVIFNMKIRVKGVPPSPPFFLVSNHLSYLDILPMFLTLKCTFVAKKEVKYWPLLGFMVRNVEVIFVDRKVRKDVIRVNRLFDEAYNKLQGIVIFPEGTSSGGADVLAFKSPLLEFPASRHLPVYYASLHYRTSDRDEPAVNSVCFFGARDSFAGHLFKMVKTRKIYCTIHFGSDPVVSDDRKKLAVKLQNGVKSVFEKTDL